MVGDLTGSTASADGSARKRSSNITSATFPGRGVSRRDLWIASTLTVTVLVRGFARFVDERVDDASRSFGNSWRCFTMNWALERRQGPTSCARFCSVGDLLIGAMPTDFAFESAGRYLPRLHCEASLGAASRSRAIASAPNGSRRNRCKHGSAGSKYSRRSAWSVRRTKFRAGGANADVGVRDRRA